MSSLNLTPNEIRGYRILPDQHNWTVVQIKVHGGESKKAGQEYAVPMAYCKNPLTAIEYIMRTVTALETRKEQEKQYDLNGNLAQLESIKEGYTKALNIALDAVKDLENKLLNNDKSFTDFSLEKSDIKD